VRRGREREGEQGKASLARDRTYREMEIDRWREEHNGAKLRAVQPSEGSQRQRATDRCKSIVLAAEQEHRNRESATKGRERGDEKCW
jgi:hypothetical protein